MLACNDLNANGLSAIRQVVAQLVGTTDHRKVVVGERQKSFVDCLIINYYNSFFKSSISGSASRSSLGSSLEVR